MTISITTLILWSLVCTVLGATVSALIVWEYQDKYWLKQIKYIQADLKDAKQQVNNWRHWTNVYRRLLDESEKKNTIIINEQPKGGGENV